MLPVREVEVDGVYSQKTCNKEKTLCKKEGGHGVSTEE